MKKGINVFRWIGAVIFFIMAIGSIGNKGYLAALLLILGGIIILPIKPIVLIRNKLNLKKTLTIIISAALLVVGIMAMPATDTPTKSSDNVTNTIAGETSDKEPGDNASTTSEATTKAISSSASSVQSADKDSQNDADANNNDQSIGKSETDDNSKKVESKTSTNDVTSKESNNNPQQSTGNENKNNKDRQTVYITETGKKYHSRKSCPGLSNANSITETTLSAAEMMGLTPCAKCH